MFEEPLEVKVCYCLLSTTVYMQFPAQEIPVQGHECQDLHTFLYHMLLSSAGDKVALWCYTHVLLFTTSGK